MVRRGTAWSRRRAVLALGFLSGLIPGPAFPQDAGPAQGHSLHGEAFNEGPRQAARRIAGTGKVHFEVSSKAPDVQAFIDQGFGQLHGYWYYEAERSFRQAAALDPECAIAYWGMALANVNNVDRAKKFMAKATEKAGKASPREKKYLDAWKAYYDKAESTTPEKKDGEKKDAEKNDAAKKEEITKGESTRPERGRTGDRENANVARRKALVKALEGIIYDHPDDLEARALLVAQLWENNSKGVPLVSFVAMDALIKDVLSVNPEHPVHHYRIHIWDIEKANQGLAAAANCGPAAPGIAHMWHMPGHIYSKLKRYDDAAWQQEASARTDHAYMVGDLILPDQIHNYAHNNEWLTRDLTFIGRGYDALEMTKALIRNPAHPKYNAYDARKSFGFGRERMSEVLTAFELWDETLCLADSPFFNATNLESEQVRRLRLLGRACFRKGDLSRGCEVLGDVMRLKQQVIDERDAAIAKAKADGKPTGKAESDAKGRLPRLEEAIAELSGYVHLHYGAYDDAKASFAAAGKMDQSTIADLRFRSGKGDEAIDLLRREVKSHQGEVLPQARLVEMLARAGRTDDAKKEFEALRPLAADLDPRTPIFARLADLAKGWGIHGDWRTPRPAKTDVGQRPPLDSLGPFSWTVPAASPWRLPGEGGGEQALADAAGRPQVVVFSLGAECLHCSEQVQKFADERKKFAAAGLKPVIISSDPVASLHKAAEAWKGDPTEQGAPYPFPLLSDESLATFKAWRCFDDFEGRPLHGTFLVDGNGKLQWWDIGPEPFMNVDFLIEESKRLLAIDAALASPGRPQLTPCTPPSAETQAAVQPAAQ
ncbi:Putative peroxiredoxin [Caulifigura coniformis]|uniref:Peroxiredoxin n=1 Tax=Caulifigura coniformis TaxID=2527983 RepID=A0A517SK53_9PLAN|nr:redoxin domain-containing protein [Caulifigura coniformis]QDT56491.1 Putative peroxiredoxin [Caulifigura coniformis]